MKQKKVWKRMAAATIASAVLVTAVPLQTMEVYAGSFTDEDNTVMLDSGGYKTEVFGVGTDDWGQSYKNRTETLPPRRPPWPWMRRVSPSTRALPPRSRIRAAVAMRVVGVSWRSL